MFCQHMWIFREKPIFAHQYIFDRNPGLLCLLETGTVKKSNIINMATYQDTNEQQNKECAFLNENSLKVTQLVEISEQSKA